MDIPLILYAGNLSLNFEGTPEELFQAIRNRLRGSISSDSVLIGDIEDTIAPAFNVGPWFDGKKWLFWDGSVAAYVPETRAFDGPNPSLNEVLSANPTAQRLVYLPDKSGTLLLVNDIYVPRALVILTAAPFVIDWTRSCDFLCRLTHNPQTFLMVGSREGQKISVFIQNTGTNYGTIWPAFIQWPNGGREPAMPISQSGRNTTVEWKFVNINGVIYGEQTSATTNANPANTVFVGGATTITGREPSPGFHSTAKSSFPTGPIQ